MKRALGVLTAIAALFGANARQIQQPAQSQPMVIQNRQKKVSSVVDDLFPGGSGQRNPYRHQFPDYNQRQYRKLVRQCPWIKRSKKFRNKN